MDEGKRKERNWDVRDVITLRWGGQWQWLRPALGESFSREPDSCDSFPSKQDLFLKCFNVVPQIISPLKRESRSKKCDNYTLFSKLKIEKLVQIPTAHGVGRPVTTALQMWLGLALPDVVGCSKVPNVHTL